VSVGNPGGVAAGGERGIACKGDGGAVLNCCGGLLHRESFGLPLYAINLAVT
jgi:hypothetical protein